MSQGHKDDGTQVLFFESSRIYEHIPKKHFYEVLGQILDLEFVYALTKPLYADRVGRPSIDPKVFFKCMLIAFFENITYDTQLEFRIADSITLRKFLGYGLDEKTPDESTLRKTRQKMPEEAFRAVFDHVLSICQKRGMLKGRVVGTDSTVVDANASMDSLVHKELGCTYEEFMLALRRQDAPGASKGEAIQADRDRKGKAGNSDWESSTDPDARVMQHADGHTHLSYKIDTTVDLETGLIANIGADHANVSDQQDFLEKVDEAKAVLAERGMELQAVVADKGHHSAENLAGLEERGILGLVSSPNTNRGKPGFRREDFRYDEERDILTCPMGHELTRLSKSDKTHRHYKAKGRACRACPHFGECTTNQMGRAVSISIHEDLIRANRERVRSEEMRPLMQIRRQRGEAPFGYFKQFGGMRRMSGRGLGFVTKKSLMAGLGWNLLVLIKALSRDSGACQYIWRVIQAILDLLDAILRPNGRYCGLEATFTLWQRRLAEASRRTGQWSPEGY